MAGPTKKSDTIYFRARPGLLERIDREAALMGTNRSAFLRMLVQQGMGDPTALAVLRGTYYQYQSVSRRTIGKAIAQPNENLAVLIEEAIAEGGADEGGARWPCPRPLTGTRGGTCGSS